jgi:cell division protein ZapA (FtsZ GTPase activity inhibitor)
MTTRRDHLLELNILGQTYQVRVQGAEEWAKKVGALADETMREVQKGTRLNDTTKIAILAALNMADRLLVLQEKQSAFTRELEEVSSTVAHVLDEASA